MISTSLIRRASRAARQGAPGHLFVVGQAVRLKDGFVRPTLATDIYHITGTLPPLGNLLQYRIRNDDERHERVTTQDSLEAVDMLQYGSGAALIETTFGHGERPETKRSRDQEAEEEKGSPESESTFGNQGKVPANADASQAKASVEAVLLRLKQH